MTRNKLTPRRLIAKTSGAKSTISVYKPRISLPPLPATEVFTSNTGVRGELLRLGHRRHSLPLTAPNAASHTHVVFLPGNPGIIEYYRPLLRSIFHRLPQDVKEKCTLHGVGLPGHDLRQLNDLAEFVVEDHVQYCRSYLHSDEISPPIAGSRTIFIGHSYGSFLAMRLFEALGKSVIENAAFVMLMPALHQMGACAGAIARGLLSDKWATTTWAAWAVTAFTPPVLRERIVEALGHDRAVSDVTSTMLDGRRRGLYLNICSLARDEVTKILEPEDLRYAKDIGERSLLVYADDDKWCTQLGIDKIQKAFGPKLQSQGAGEGVQHAFVLSQMETDKVARDLAPWISEKIRR